MLLQLVVVIVVAADSAVAGDDDDKGASWTTLGGRFGHDARSGTVYNTLTASSRDETRMSERQR